MPDFVDEFLLMLKLSKEVTESFSNLLVVTAPTIDHRSFLGRTYLLGAQGTIKMVTQTFFHRIPDPPPYANLSISFLHLSGKGSRVWAIAFLATFRTLQMLSSRLFNKSKGSC